MASVPVIIAVAIFCNKLGKVPSGSGPVIASLIGTYRPILNPANKICLYIPALNPPNKDMAPSSAATVLIVPMSPVYLGV